MDAVQHVTCFPSLVQQRMPAVCNLQGSCFLLDAYLVLWAQEHCDEVVAGLEPSTRRSRLSKQATHGRKYTTERTQIRDLIVTKVGSGYCRQSKLVHSAIPST